MGDNNGLNKAISYGFNDELGNILDIMSQASSDQADSTFQKAEIAEAMQEPEKESKCSKKKKK